MSLILKELIGVVQKTINLIQPPYTQGLEGDIDSLLTELSTAFVHKTIISFPIST